MEKRINPEIRDYQEKLWFGLTLRQFVCSILAVGVAVGLYLLLRGRLHPETVSLDTLPNKEQACQEQLANLQVQLETAKVEIEKPFPREVELKSKTARLEELNALLNLDKKEPEILDGEPEQENKQERSEPER